MVGPQSEGGAFRLDAGAPSYGFASGRDLALELLLCTPGIGPTPLAHFVTRYCHTLGPTGQPTLIPDWAFVLRYLEGYEKRKPRVMAKTRQNLLSHLACVCRLHSLMFRDGYAGVVGSADAGLVDDGGENSTCDSLFGRIRYAYLHLPRWLRDYAPVVFTKNRIVCRARQSYLVGDSRKGNIGRGGTYWDGLIDEAAYIEFGEASLAAAEPACEVLDLQSTPNGRKNMLARLFHAAVSNYVRETYGWWEIPHRAVGLYRDPEDGRMRSPWYDERTRDLSDERRAREYDLDFTTSTSGLVYKEFVMTRPPVGQLVPAAEMPFDPSLPLGIGLDFGHARKTAGVLVQLCGAQLRVVADFEGKHRDAGSNARDLVQLVREVGFDGRLDLVQLHPDPAGQFEDQGSGHSVLSYYHQAGFTNWHFPMLQGPQSVRLGIALVREKLVAREILVSDRCERFLDRIQDYRYPTDPRTDDIRSDNPVHNMASHIMDALRYAVTALFTAAGDSSGDTFRGLEEQRAEDPLETADLAVRPGKPSRLSSFSQNFGEPF